MEKDQEKKPDQNQYHFMNETIKERPQNEKKIFKTGAIVGSGILFGISAAAAFSIAKPVFNMLVKNTEKPEVHIMENNPVEEQEKPEVHIAQTQTESIELEGDSKISYLTKYNEIYEEIQEIAAPALKSVVMAEAISADANLLDDKPLSVGISQGFILDIGKRYVYILIDGSRLPEEKQFRITFSDKSTADGWLCKRDRATGLVALKVPVTSIDDSTWDYIGSAVLLSDTIVDKPQMVIAAGNLCGDMNTVLYGMTTSVNGSISVTDAEYQKISTNICGTKESGGVLLDISGNIIGLILGNNEGEMLEAIGIPDITSLISALCTEEETSFLGITGEEVSEQESKHFRVPRGVYINKVELNSPAMEAGILKGDIIQKINEKNVRNMKDYMEGINGVETAKIFVQRKDAEGNYREIEFETVIKKR